MEEYLFSGERVLETKRANFSIDLEEKGVRKFGLLGADAEMQLAGLPRGSESLGGHLYLTSCRLFFQAHKLNRITGTLSIFLQSVSGTKDISRSLSKMVEIYTPEYNFTFIVWGISKLMAAITLARDAMTPGEIELIKTEAAASSEKWGDGLKLFPSLFTL